MEWRDGGGGADRAGHSKPVSHCVESLVWIVAPNLPDLKRCAVNDATSQETEYPIDLPGMQLSARTSLDVAGIPRSVAMETRHVSDTQYFR